MHLSLLTPSLSIADCQAFAAEMSCLSLTPLLVLVLGVSLGAAFPHHTLRKDCSLSKYQTIASEEKEAMDKMRQEFVSTAGNAGLWAGRGQGRGDAEFNT